MLHLIKLTVTACLSLAAVSACSQAPAQVEVPPERETGLRELVTYGGYALGDVAFFTDTNGCQYLIFYGYSKAGMTPRMNPDGTQVCLEVTQ